MKMQADDDNALNALTPEERAALADEPAAAEGEATEQTSPEPEYRSDPAPVLVAQPIENASDLLRQLAAAEENLASQFEDGDITSREYRDGMARLSEDRDEIKWATRKAHLANEIRETAERAAWHREVNAFMTKGPGAHLTKSHGAMVAFDEVVKKVTADPANERLSDRAQLEKAFKIYQADMARAGFGATDQLETARALGDMGGGRGGVDFGSIDAMISRGDLAGVERALAGMSREERDAYGL
jgi:hypothetical protein